MEQDLKTELATDDLRRRVLTWLRGGLPDHPFDGLRELESVNVPVEVVPPGGGHILDGLFPPDDALNPLRIRVDRRFTGDRLEGYRLCASDRVGIAAVGDKGEDGMSATLVVRPKVSGASLLRMLSYALAPDLSPDQRPDIAVKDAPVVSLLVLLYLLRLRQLTEEHGLQRAYIRLQESLRGTIRGRCQMPVYLQRHLPRGAAQVVPCEYWELRVDSEPNRALRWGVEVCRLLALRFPPPELVQAVEDLWDALASHFAAIPVVPFPAERVRRLPRSGRFAPYGPVLELLEFLLDHVSLDLARGQVRVRGFAVAMWEVFERFVVNVLAGRLRGAVEGPQVGFSYRVEVAEGQGPTGHIRLDALVRRRCTLVLDAKWKEALLPSPADFGDGEGLELEDLRIRNADLFQIVAYGCHRDVRAQAGLLVYPVLEEGAVCRKRRVTGFLGAEGGRPFPVYLVGIPVGEHLDRSVEDFLRVVQEIEAECAGE